MVCVKHKRLMTGLLLGTLFLGSSGMMEVQASYMRQVEPQYVTKIENALNGDWYDHDGNLVLQIHDGYINGCQILAVYDLAGATGHGDAQFRILESTGERMLQLSWWSRHTDRDSLKLNDSQMLHRVAKLSYHESVAGIHLGMDSAEVKSVLGEPSATGDMKPYLGWTMYGWYYADQKLIVTFDADCVDRIILLKGSSQVLKTTGLNCSNTPAEFAAAYHMKRVPKVDFADEYSDDGCHDIGNGEYLSFGNHMSHIMLTIYSY